MVARNSILLVAASGLLFAGCSTVPRANKRSPLLVQAATDLKHARRTTLSTEVRAGLYLEAAALGDSQLGDNGDDPAARAIYNSATAELTDLLQEGDGGKFWNHPLISTVRGTEYTLRFAPKTKKGIWSPAYFTDFKLASEMKSGRLRHQFKEEGVGGTLVGIHKTPTGILEQRPAFESKVGLVAPVTATIDFKGRDGTLTLRDPFVVSTTPIHGKPQPLAADFSAPIAFYPRINELWYGIMGLMQVEKFMRIAGLYMIHPYDPDRIPVILVHGLISTPQMWKNVINELEADPQLRGRYQFWAFSYPTGNTPVYSALLCREELAKMEKLHPGALDSIMIGHSMGGLVSRMQVTTTGRAVWNANFEQKADRFYERLPAEHVIKKSLIFKANPKVKKVVFICVPHRGSKLALSSLGAIGSKLISLPASMVTTLKTTALEMLQLPTGKIFMPNSITGLSPKNRTLLAMDKLPIRAPHHSIIGDRGRCDTPNSSDGVVPYWSSHLDTARSEVIVPGPHGSYELPETIDELKRILTDHLKTVKNANKAK